jgi:2-methylcitrate dehydratase PrpD
MSLTTDLCNKIAALSADDIPDDAFARADQVALDALSVALAGTTQEPPQILSGHVRSQEAKPESTAIGFGFKTSPFYAAYLNGASMHVLDFEPMSNPANHATSPVLPGVLALGERFGSDGRTIATALIKGIEMEGRLRIAEGHPGAYKFHTPGVVGPMGSAVATASMLGLDAGQTAFAIGIAASRSGALSANSGTMTKCTHCGLGGANGLDAAMLAAQGFTASADVLDHKRGWAFAYLQDGLDPGSLLGYGDTWRICDPGYAIKLFPAQYTTHWGINAALAAREVIGELDAVESLVLTIPDVENARRPLPTSGLDGKFSLQYTLAAAIIDGPLGIDHFVDTAVERADIQALLGKISLDIDPEIPDPASARWVVLDITMKNGDTHQFRCDKPLGHYHLEPVTPERHRIKIHDCVGRVLSAEAEEEFVTLAGRLHTLTAPEVSRLMEICA